MGGVYSASLVAVGVTGGVWGVKLWQAVGFDWGKRVGVGHMMGRGVGEFGGRGRSIAGVRGWVVW